MPEDENTPYWSVPAGTVLDSRYRLVEVCGQGASGVVYRATNLSLDVPVAIKVLRPDLIRDNKSIERLRREAAILSKLNSPGIVSVKAIILSTAHAYIVMDLINGQTLKEHIAKSGPLSPARIKSIFSTVSDALASAHESNILHRDIKPGNILIEEDSTGAETAKLIDFGLCMNLEDNAERSRLTTAGAIAGTPSYMSPEQCRGGKLDERSDIYALGCVMYEAATGRQPFNAESQYAVMELQLKEQVVFRRDDAVSKSMQELIRSCMEKDPNKRVQSARQLNAILIDLDTSKLSPPQIHRQTSLSPTALFLLLLSLGVAGTAVALAVRQQQIPSATYINAQRGTPAQLGRRRLARKPFESALDEANFHHDNDGEDQSVATKLYKEISSRPDLGTVSPPVLFDFYVSYANHQRIQKDCASAQNLLRKAAGLSAKLHDSPQRISDYLAIEERVLEDLEDFVGAEARMKRRLAITRDELRRPDLWTQAAMDLADLQLHLDSSGKRSISTMNEAIDRSEPGQIRTRLSGHRAKAFLLSNQESQYKQALEDLRALQDPRAAGIELVQVACELSELSRSLDGLQVGREALKRLEIDSRGHPFDYVRCCTLLAKIYRDLGRRDEALAMCSRASDLLSRLEKPPAVLLNEVDAITRELHNANSSVR